MFCRGTICSIVNCLSGSVRFPCIPYILLHPTLMLGTPFSNGQSNRANASWTFVLLAFFWGCLNKPRISHCRFYLRNGMQKRFLYSSMEGGMSGSVSGKGLGEIWREVSCSPPAKISWNSAPTQKKFPVSARAHGAR